MDDGGENVVEVEGATDGTGDFVEALFALEGVGGLGEESPAFDGDAKLVAHGGEDAHFGGVEVAFVGEDEVEDADRFAADLDRDSGVEGGGLLGVGEALTRDEVDGAGELVVEKLTDAVALMPVGSGFVVVGLLEGGLVGGDEVDHAVFGDDPEPASLGVDEVGNGFEAFLKSTFW